jgi:hypothetical protein
MSLEMEVQMLRRAIQDLTKAMLGHTSPEDEVIHIEVITPTHMAANKQRGRPAGIIEATPRQTCFSSCCGSEGHRWSSVMQGCKGCVQ